MFVFGICCTLIYILSVNSFLPPVSWTPRTILVEKLCANAWTITECTKSFDGFTSDAHHFAHKSSRIIEHRQQFFTQYVNGSIWECAGMRWVYSEFLHLMCGSLDYDWLWWVLSKFCVVGRFMFSGGGGVCHMPLLHFWYQCTPLGFQLTCTFFSHMWHW